MRDEVEAGKRVRLGRQETSDPVISGDHRTKRGTGWSLGPGIKDVDCDGSRSALPTKELKAERKFSQ